MLADRPAQTTGRRTDLNPLVTENTMRLLATTALLITAGLLGACGTNQIKGWSKPGGTQEQKDRDMAECDYDASKSTTGSMRAPRNTDEAVGDGVVRGMEKSDLIKQCMRLRGYQ